MIALHDSSVSLGLASFYHLVLVVRNEELKAVLQKCSGRRLEIKGITNVFKTNDKKISVFIKNALNYLICTVPYVYTPSYNVLKM